MGKCVHGRQKCRCKDCGGASICVHGRQKRQCKDCGGSGLCVHNRQKSRCKDCGGSGRRHQNDVNSSGHGLPKGPKKRRLGAGDVARDALGRIHVEDGLMRMVCHAHVNSSGQGVPMGPKKMRVGAGAGSKRPAKVNPSGQGLPKLPQGPQTEDGGRPSDSTKGDAATAGIFFDRAQSFKEAVHLAMVNMCATNIVSGPIVKTEPSQDEDGGVSLDHNAGCVMQFANNERFLTDLNGRPIGRAWGLSKAGLASTKVSMINAARKEGGIPLLSGDETLNVLNQYGRAEGYDPKALHSLARAQRPDDLDYEGRCAQTRLFNYLDATRDILPTKVSCCRVCLHLRTCACRTPSTPAHPHILTRRGGAHGTCRFLRWLRSSAKGLFLPRSSMNGAFPPRRIVSGTGRQI